MEEATDNENIVEEREDLLMVSVFSDGKPNLRKAHFLKPSSSSIDEPIPLLSSLSPSFLPHKFEPEKWPLNACFIGWKKPSKCWVFWVDLLRPKYQPVWEKAGIFQAIMSSTCSIKRYNDLIIGLVEKWNPETNSFIFPWGETTISLEDVMILGGYSVIGLPVTSPADTQELREVEDKLLEECRKIRGVGKRIRPTYWVKSFMGSGRDVEHEAFLSMWLTLFVFRDFNGVIRKRVFPIAGHLAKGEVMALGPAVLASIYRDLAMLKETIVGSSKVRGAEVDDYVLKVRLCSPLQLLQLWAWERFPTLQPKPNVIHNFDPRAARWSNVNIVNVENMRMVLDSAGEIFYWRPYAKVLNYWQFPEFYKEKEEWISVTPSLSKDLLSFALCLRPSELVGLGSDSGCIQQYLPHRVAMQFGIDQDIPCRVSRSNETPEIAWRNYMRPITDNKLYVPSRFFESDITIQYLEWWKKVSMVVQRDAIKGIVQRKRSSRKRPERIPWVKPRKGENDASVPPGFPPKLKEVKPEPIVYEVRPEDFEASDKKASVTTGLFNLAKCSVDIAQSISPSVADNGGFASMEFSVTPTQKAVQINTENGGSARVTGEENESEVECPLTDKENTSKNTESSTMELYLIASVIEDRVTEIEKSVSELRAALGIEVNTSKGR